MASDEGYDHHNLSDEGHENLRQAIEAACNEGGRESGMLTGFMVIAAQVTAENLEENSTTYQYFIPNGQPLHVSMGLEVMLRKYLEYFFNDN